MMSPKSLLKDGRYTPDWIKDFYDQICTAGPLAEAYSYLVQWVL